MSQNAYRPKSLLSMKYKSKTPISQPSQNNVKKKFTQQGKEQEQVDEVQEINVKNRESEGQKLNLNQTIQYAIQNNNFIKQSQNVTDQVNIGGIILVQNKLIPSRRVMTAFDVKKQYSSDQNDLNYDEFRDLNLVDKKLKLNTYEIRYDIRSGTSKQIRHSIKSQQNQSALVQQNETSSTSSISAQNNHNSKNQISNNLINNVQNTKGDKYTSIKDKIAEFKEVEQQIVMKNSQQIVSPPILITTNQQSPQSENLNSLQLLKQDELEDKLNIEDLSCQLNQFKNSEKITKNKNKQNHFVNNGNTTNTSQTTNNKENSTSVSTTSTNSGSAIFSLLLNPPSAFPSAFPPSRLINANSFRIKKQNSTRNSFIQSDYIPSSQTQITQINKSQIYDGSNNHSYQMKILQNESNYFDNQVDKESLSIERNIQFNNAYRNNTQKDEILNNKYQNTKESQLITQTPYNPLQFNKQEQNQSEKNDKMNFCSSRQIQFNKQISLVSKYKKNSYKNSGINLGHSSICRKNVQAQSSLSCVNSKVNQQKISSTFLQMQHSQWSPDTSVVYQNDTSLDQIPCSTNRSQSTYSRPNNYYKSNQMDEVISQNLIRSSLQLSQNKQNYSEQILNSINCADIKPLYWRQGAIDASDNKQRNILIIKADNLLFGGITTQNFWDKKDNIINNLVGSNINVNFNINYSLANNINENTNMIGGMYVSKLNEIKKIFRNLSRYYQLFLLFNNQNKKVRDLVSYMIKTNFSFDGVYYISSSITNTYQTKSINLQQIIIDFKIVNINKVVILDAVPYNFQVNINQNLKKNQIYKPQNSVSSKGKQFRQQTLRSRIRCAESESQLQGYEQKLQEEQLKDEDNEFDKSKLINYKLKTKIHFDLLQDFIPKFEDNSILEKTKIVLFKQKFNPNLLQANQKKVLEVALSFVDSKIKSFSNNLYFINLDITEVTAKAYEEGVIENKKRNFLMQINNLKQQNKNTKEITELDADKVAENFRNRLIEYMKSTQKQIPNLYYLVGDLVVRNRAIFQKYYTESFYCKKKNIDNLLQLDILRYKPFPQLIKQTFFKGKQEQQYQSLIKQLPEQNPYQIMFDPEDNQLLNNQSETSLKRTSNVLDELEQITQNKEQQEEENKKKINNQISYFLPFNIYLCTEIS